MKSDIRWRAIVFVALTGLCAIGAGLYGQRGQTSAVGLLIYGVAWVLYRIQRNREGW
jgi:hypothetical protein